MPKWEVEEGSVSGHSCCFQATVVDADRIDPDDGKPGPICECSTAEDAEMICQALRFFESKK